MSNVNSIFIVFSRPHVYHWAFHKPRSVNTLKASRNNFKGKMASLKKQANDVTRDLNTKPMLHGFSILNIISLITKTYSEFEQLVLASLVLMYVQLFRIT